MKIFDNFLRYLRARMIFKLIPKNKTVCDIGCGRNAYFFKKYFSDMKYGFGFDRDINPCEDQKIKLQKIDLEEEELPLKAELIDVVVMSAVLEHLDNPIHILREIYRVLKNGGILVLTTPSPKAKAVLEFLAFEMKIISQKDILEHKAHFNPSQIKDLLLSVGFRGNSVKIKYFECGFNILATAEK